MSVGYRVNYRKVASFRQWATSILHRYMPKGIRYITCFKTQYKPV
ncbi:virulence RhuM family protein [Streptococcus cristatus]|nr:virulence RhuM family protein [Streptococcus cristatus]